MAPTLTNPLQPRQTTVVVADSNGDGGGGGNGGLDSGAIVGIVLGTIAGILLLWWIIRSCTKPARPDTDRQGWYDDTPPRRSRSRSTHSHRYHHHHGRHHSRSHSRSHSRRSTSRPVILQEKPVTGYAVQAPQQAYVYPSRSRSRSQGRYYATNEY
ncbi:hypothetical protein QBC36DRAFT_123489 [Triangularia setosa]|uniref:Uncharacterized protein n=1 Tax=Triangularia setosa TaxID=2587417 RepID=A0AAN7A9Z5_9PEZI|nr:hypothetical protein QBC36DRAFT_123489 [Podospora setosa]